MSETLRFVLALVGAVVLYSCHALSTCALMQFRYSKRAVVLWWIAYVFISTALSVLFISLSPQWATQLVFFSTLVLYIALCFVLTDYPLPKQCFITANYVTCYVILHSVGTVLAKSSPDPYLVAVAIRTGLYALLIPVFWRYLRSSVIGLRFPHERDWWPMSIAATVIAAVLILRTMLLNTHEFFNSNESLLALLSIVVMLTAVYWVIFRSIGYIEKLAESEREALRVKLYEVQLAAMREAEEDARRRRHDMRHHDLVISEYLNAENYDGLRQYLSNGKTEAERAVYQRYCENDIANSIIAAYSKKAAASGVALAIKAAMPQDTELSPDNIVAILANLMDNGIRGAAESGAVTPFFELTVQQKSRKLLIAARNSCSDDVTFRDGRPVRKHGSGVGVDSILHAVRCYDGQADFSATDGVFTCRILLNLH